MFVPRAGYFGVRSAFWYCMRIYRGEMPPKIARNQNRPMGPAKVDHTGATTKLTAAVAAAAITAKPLLTTAVKSAGAPFVGNRPYSRKFSDPFKSFVTTGSQMALRKRRDDSGDFAYHLSAEELPFLGAFGKPMKDVPASERDILSQGKREAYLNVRNGHSPDDKYNYPEATSWRIGWFHKNQMAGSGQDPTADAEDKREAQKNDHKPGVTPDRASPKYAGWQ